MGLIGWIKKEIESSSRQRRQSAPMPVIHNISSPNEQRDEAYIRALTRFNEWRNHQRFERLNETKNASAITQANLNKTADDVCITDVEIEEDEKVRLLAGQKLSKQQNPVVYSNCKSNEINAKKRLSLPAKMHNSTMIDNNEHRRVKMFQPTSTINEIEEFEQNHCQNNIEDYTLTNLQTPPRKFYRVNSNPYDGNQKAQETNTRKSTPKRWMGKNLTRKPKGKAPQPPTLQATKNDQASESSMNFCNGNYKRYDMTSTSMYDEFVISSKGYKGNMRNEQPEKTNSVGESASSESLSSVDPDKNVKKQRRLSPPYQTVINKHGDEVEYALPYNERDSMLDIPPLPTAPIPGSNNVEQIIDQNFKFLNSKLDFLHSQIDDGDDCAFDRKMIDEIFTPVDASFSDVRRRQNLQVTDLDKSNEAGLAASLKTNEVIRDLEVLSKWTENVDINGLIDEKKLSPLSKFQAIQNNIKIFNAHDIKYKSSALRNSFSTPLEFGSGYFHHTAITLRSTLPNNYNISSFADYACKKEFEILCQIKYCSVVTLMGVCFDADLRVTSLVFEPFDYTLNHYIHQMDKFFNIQQTVSIIHQIASATQYLHECGFIHSNINSHAVLIRDSPFAVKLSSFELCTEILPREGISKVYRLQRNDVIYDQLFTQEIGDPTIIEKYNKLSKQHFYNRTSLPVSKYQENDETDDSEYRLPYSIAYRRMFTMHYYQAPELLVPTNVTSVKHVMPSTSADIYGLTLLLWELINRVVPYVVYNHDELIDSMKNGKAQLPMVDKSSIIFKEIFEACLHADASKRISDCYKFIIMLEDLHLLNHNKKKESIELLEIIEPRVEAQNDYKTTKNIKNCDQRDKLKEKIYFSNAESDAQKRIENAMTTDNLISLGIGADDKASESVQSSEIEPQITSFTHEPEILHDEALEYIRKIKDHRFISPQMPVRKEDDEKFEISKNSTMFQSFFDLNRLQTPKVDKNVIYERTSTLKKRLKANDYRESKKTVRGLFDDDADSKTLHKELDKINAELNSIIQDTDKSDFLHEIVKECKEREKTNNNGDQLLSSFLNQGMANHIHDSSRSSEDLPKAHNKENVVKIKRSESDMSSQFNRHESGDFSWPNTPIARQNLIRRNQWLSDSKKPIGISSVSDEIAKRSLSFISNSPSSENNRKMYNLNIKIHHNNLDANTPKGKSTNIDRSQNNSLINIKLYNSGSKQSPTVNVKPLNLNQSSYTEDINKKYYPMMPEMLSDVIQNKRNSTSFVQSATSEVCKSAKHASGSAKDENDSDEEKVIVPEPKSVRDTVNFIETNFKPKTANLMTGTRNKFISQKHEETQTEPEIQKLNDDFPWNDNQNGADDAVECLMQASESIQKLENLHANDGKPVIFNKRVDSIVNHATISTQTPKKVTTKVTVNLKKITGRSSDVSHLKHFQEQARHSICNTNADVLKRWKVQQIQKKDGGDNKASCELATISASCSSLVARECNGELVNGKKSEKYFCRNCGFTMIPAAILQKIQNSGRLSIASSVADSLQSIQYDETSLQSIAAIRKCQQFAKQEAKSTEDLYIDDDFCQGITNSLAANMELLPPPDFFDTFDFNILAAEIFHTQEHNFDDTLTHDDGELQKIDYNAEDDEVFYDKNCENEKVSEGAEKQDVPICNNDANDETENDNKQEIVDEPKVETQ